jgi:hypothetical protein
MGERLVGAYVHLLRMQCAVNAALDCNSPGKCSSTLAVTSHPCMQGCACVLLMQHVYNTDDWRYCCEVGQFAGRCMASCYSVLQYASGLAHLCMNRECVQQHLAAQAGCVLLMSCLLLS